LLVIAQSVPAAGGSQNLLFALPQKNFRTGGFTSFMGRAKLHQIACSL
jgi:hypothetical protein